MYCFVKNVVFAQNQQNNKRHVNVVGIALRCREDYSQNRNNLKMKIHVIFCFKCSKTFIVFKTYNQVYIQSGQDKHFKVLIPMQEHVQQERVLLIVQRVREHLKQLGVLDAEPGKRLRVRYVRGRVVSVGEVKERQPIRIVERLARAVVHQHQEHVATLPGEQTRRAVDGRRVVRVRARRRGIIRGQVWQIRHQRLLLL